MADLLKVVRNSGSQSAASDRCCSLGRLFAHGDFGIGERQTRRSKETQTQKCKTG
jgi:hypothetical protein